MAGPTTHGDNYMKRKQRWSGEETHRKVLRAGVPEPSVHHPACHLVLVASTSDSLEQSQDQSNKSIAISFKQAQ